jgi:hypothetical protein
MMSMTTSSTTWMICCMKVTVQADTLLIGASVSTIVTTTLRTQILKIERIMNTLRRGLRMMETKRMRATGRLRMRK